MTREPSILYDISPPLSPGLAVFPGDTPLSREIVLDLNRGDPVTLSTLRATCHLGAHVDAPSHYDLRGVSIGERPLDPFLGRCRVVRVEVDRGVLVTPIMVREALQSGPCASSGGRPDAARVLIATGTYPDPAEFRRDFAALSPDLIDWLAEAGVLLLGIDTPSVDPADSKELSAHAAVRRHDMNILEGVVLDRVPRLACTSSSRCHCASRASTAARCERCCAHCPTENPRIRHAARAIAPPSAPRPPAG